MSLSVSVSLCVSLSVSLSVFMYACLSDSIFLKHYSELCEGNQLIHERTIIHYFIIPNQQRPCALMQGILQYNSYNRKFRNTTILQRIYYNIEAHALWQSCPTHRLSKNLIWVLSFNDLHRPIPSEWVQRQYSPCLNARYTPFKRLPSPLY